MKPSSRNSSDDCCSSPGHAPHLADPILSRREFLARFGMGIGTIGMATLLGKELFAPAHAADVAISPLAPRPPHFPAHAKRVLHIFAQGAPSHIDTWDPKPALQKLDGKALADVE